MPKTINEKTEVLSINNKDKFIWKDGEIDIVRDPKVVKKYLEEWLEKQVELEIKNDTSRVDGNENQEPK